MNQNRYRVYFTERFPLIPNLLSAFGIVLTAGYWIQGDEISKRSIAFGVVGALLFLFQIRLMDELKDFEKDKIAHPERPLPRGLFTVDEFSGSVKIFQIAMVFFSVLLMIFWNVTAGSCFLLGTMYLYLMFNEFFVGSWLSERPILYAITHQDVSLVQALILS